MKTKVAKWGNSLALRIPRELASSHRLEEGSSVEIIEENGGLRLRPVAKRPSLEELLQGITKENLQEEFNVGTSRGKEVW